MKRIIALLLILGFAVTASATLPVTRLFDSGAGTIPTGGEPNWAYNSVATFKIDAGNTFVTNNDNTSDTAMHWTGDTFAVNHCSSVVLGVISTNGAGIGRGYGPAVRMDTATTQKTYVRLVGDSHGYELQRFSNGTGSGQLVSNATAFVAGHTVELCVRKSGANDIYSFTDNGAVMVGSPYTDTSPLTGGAAGVASSSTLTNLTGIESWTGRNMSVATVGPIIFN